jgi:hypothetical protein
MRRISGPWASLSNRFLLSRPGRQQVRLSLTMKMYES